MKEIDVTENPPQEKLPLENPSSELDAFFGPKPDVEMPKPQATQFGGYPVRIRSICDAFIEEMGWHTDPTTKKIVAAGAKRFIDVHGDDVPLLVRTIKHLRRNAKHIYKNIGSPGSLVTPARNMTPDPDSEESRQKYVWEVDDE